MRRALLSADRADSVSQHGPALIAAGVAMLVAAAVWPTIPVVTAMALVALGATDVTMARYRAAPAFVPLMLLHLVTYTALYSMFFGAMLHGAATRSAGGLAVSQIIDLATSVVPMAVAAWLSARAMWNETGDGGKTGGGDAPAR